MKNIVLIPTYNEKENIKNIIEDIFRLFSDIYVMVIDDNSKDGTVFIVKNLMQNYTNLLIFERNKKTGLGDAYKEGIKKVLGNYDIRYVITMDADGSHQSIYIKNFLDNINNFDLIIGSRYVKNGGVSDWSLRRRILSKLGNIYSKILIGSKINDLTAGFICIKKELLEKIDFSKISSSGYAYQIEFKNYCEKKLNAKILEIPIIFKSRFGGESKMSNQIIREGIKTPLRLFIKRVIRK